MRDGPVPDGPTGARKARAPSESMEDTETTPSTTSEHTFDRGRSPSAGRADPVEPPAGLPLPASVRDTLDDNWIDPGRVLLAVPGDVSLEGRPVREWIVACDDRLLVVAEPLPGAGPARGIERSLRWEEVDEIRSVGGVGGGMLQAREGEDWVDLVRYSNALARRFHRVARALERARGAVCGGLVSRPDCHFDDCTEDLLDPPRCHACGLRLEESADSCPRCLHGGRILERVRALLAPWRRGAVALAGLTLLGVAAELVPPKLQQVMVDGILSRGGADAAAAPAGDVDFRTALLLVVLALAFSRVLLSAVAVLKGRIATTVGTGITSALRAEMVGKLQSLSVAYYDRHQVGSIASRVAHDSEVLHGLVHQFTGGFLLQIVQLFGVGAMLVWINPKLAAFTLIPVPLVFAGSWIFWRHVYPRHYRLWDASSKQMAALSGMLSGIRVVKAFAQEPRERDRFESASDHLREWRLWVEHANTSYAASMQVVFGLGGLIVWYVGGRDVIGGEMTLGQLIAFLAYLAMFYAPLGALSNFTTWLTSFLSGTKRVLELLDTPVSLAEPAEPDPWEAPRGAIRFRDVTFGYDRNQPVLHDVSFTVAPGEMVGIVGRSGSGKSTLVNLLARFHDVQDGGIEVDGVDIRRIATARLRERLGIVFQDSFLFRGTIWKNLSYGRPQASIAEGLRAATAAGAHDFICRQPLAYETVLGERGAGLSGGEKQRLSIARTLLYDPAILVLDEATSSIDAEAERAIQEALSVLVRGRTTIAIAHRLSTLRSADRILAFDRGRLVEQGTHEELLAADGVYARLVRIQTQITRQPTVDSLLAESAEASHRPGDDAEAGSAAAAAGPPRVADLRWLEAAEHRFAVGVHDRIELLERSSVDEGAPPRRLAAGVFIVPCFPATLPEEYLSVRTWDQQGDEVELGLIRRLADWPEAEATIVRTAVGRRSLVRPVRRVRQTTLARGYLALDVETDDGPARFSIRWTPSQAVDFGEDGKMLIDTDENRWCVPSVALLQPADRERFLRYVYW
jgi:ATP-binding cassette subfamily B protein